MFLKNKLKFVSFLVITISSIFLSSCYDDSSRFVFNTEANYVDENKTITKIAFGSCGHQSLPEPILILAAAQKPDLFLFLGDNVYTDTDDEQRMRTIYWQLHSKPEFQVLKNTSTVLATWDDHDYGTDDAGRKFVGKEMSKRVFTEFWGFPYYSPVYDREGIYYAHIFGEEEGKKVQVIMLDTRTFRDDLTPRDGNPNYLNEYQPTLSPDSTMLGETQWQWLEEQLKKDADVRVIGSSIQFGLQHNGHEGWPNMPHEIQKMKDLIRSTNAEGVVFVSGDVHYGELSKNTENAPYPIYDMTSSGITQTWKRVYPNYNRVGEAVRYNHYGLLEIDWKDEETTINLKLINSADNIKVNYTIPLSELRI